MGSDAYPLIQALFDDLAEAEKLLEATPSLLSARTGTGETALHYLVIESRLEAVRWLIEHGAAVDGEDNFGDRPLYSASSLGDDTMVRLLVEHGADVRATRPDGETPLHAAARGKHPDVVCTLLDAGAVLDARTDMEETPLFQATSNSADDVVRLLIARGADVNARAAFGQTPLHGAHSVAAAHGLIDAGADLHALDCNGATVLHAAARDGNDALCALYTQLGVDPRAKDGEGRTVEDERIRGERIRREMHEMMTPLAGATDALKQHLDGEDVEVRDIAALMNDLMGQIGIDPEGPGQ